MSDSKTTTTTTASEVVVDPFTAQSLAGSDSKLVEKKDAFGALITKYSAIPSADVIARTVKSLQDRKFIVHVVDTKADALKASLALLPTETQASFSLGGAQSLTDIGFTEWAKTQTKHTNYKGLAIANWGKPDYMKYTLLGMNADHFFTTPSAVTEDGRLLWASGSGTRVSLLAKQTIFIVGANKIVANLDAAFKRLDEYCVPLGGAMVRKKFGFPDTYNLETGILNGQAMMNPSQFVVIVCKESLGY